MVGLSDGFAELLAVGKSVGDMVGGGSDGETLCVQVGCVVGLCDVLVVGSVLGEDVGCRDDKTVGDAETTSVGLEESWTVGFDEGRNEGRDVLGSVVVGDPEAAVVGSAVGSDNVLGLAV